MVFPVIVEHSASFLTVVAVALIAICWSFGSLPTIGRPVLGDTESPHFRLYVIIDNVYTKVKPKIYIFPLAYNKAAVL